MSFFNAQNDTSFGTGNVFATVTVMQHLQRCTFLSGTVVHPKMKIQATFTHPQTRMTDFLPWNSKGEPLKNVHAALFHIGPIYTSAFLF